MPTFTGTTGIDTLIGTNGDDTIIGLAGADQIYANGGTDLLKGGAGADSYNLNFEYWNYTNTPAPYITINETNSGDGSIDTINGIFTLVGNPLSSSINYTTFTRVGIDGKNLLIETANKSASFGFYGSPAQISGTVKIINQYSVTYPEAKIEQLYANMYWGDASYFNLLTTEVGTAGNDIITGWKYDDILTGGAGNDYVSGGIGRDTLEGNEGNDVLLGEGGNDYLYGGLGDDRLLGGTGVDRVWAGDGNDVLFGGQSRDILRGDNGDDTLYGEQGNDYLNGGRGRDILNGGAGNDRLIGAGKEGDTYVFSSLGDGNDVIVDNGKTAPMATNNSQFVAAYVDEIQFTDFATLEDARRSFTAVKSGNDLILTYENAAAGGTVGQIIVRNHFLSGKFTIEEVDFGFDTSNFSGNGYHIEYLRGDQHTFSIHTASDVGGNDIVIGSAGADQIYSGFGDNILFGGGGADSFMFQDEGANAVGTRDLIKDFNIADDVLDFSEIKTLNAVTYEDNAYGNIVIHNGFTDIELDGVTAAEFSQINIVYFGAPVPVAPTPGAVNPTPIVGTGPDGTVFVGTAAADQMTGTDLADTFVFTSDTAFTAVDTIKDYLVAHGDMLDVSGALVGFNPTTSDINDFVVFASDPESDDVTMSIDADGLAGEHSLQQVAIVADARALVAQDLYDTGLLIA